MEGRNEGMKEGMKGRKRAPPRNSNHLRTKRRDVFCSGVGIASRVAAHPQRALVKRLPHALRRFLLVVVLLLVVVVGDVVVTLAVLRALRRRGDVVVVRIRIRARSQQRGVVVQVQVVSILLEPLARGRELLFAELRRRDAGAHGDRHGRRVEVDVLPAPREVVADGGGERRDGGKSKRRTRYRGGGRAARL
eukprot:31404-Pelagococcus_subviridis.AAC.9